MVPPHYHHHRRPSRLQKLLRPDMTEAQQAIMKESALAGLRERGRRSLVVSLVGRAVTVDAPVGEVRREGGEVA